MIFNSPAFLVFVAVFFPLYFALKGKARLLLALLASYFFYGWWDWRFLTLIALSTLVDYLVGAALYRKDSEAHRRRLLLLSVVVNLGFLAFFKYFDFFVDSFAALLQSVGLQPSVHSLGIILPVGISFYTFQSMSYTIDIYRRKLAPEYGIVKFATYVAFWPQLVAGPIVRASDFLPQFRRDHPFVWDRFTKGSAQVLWGFFKKVAVADSLAPFVDQCFAEPLSFASVNLYIAVFFYSFQIYCDFSGYSDIAIGFARMLGFDFPANFRTPYFSRNFSEFWTRWHISLSSWLRDYLYIPLGGNRHGAAKTYRNLMLTMLLGGLWHGANWTFVFWGWLHGMYLVVQHLLGGGWDRTWGALRAPKWFTAGLSILLVYGFTNLAWVFFRSPDFATATTVLQSMAGLEGFAAVQIMNKFIVAKGMLLVALLLAVEIGHFRWNYTERLLRHPAFRVASFAVLLWLIAFLGTFDSNAFIYFQF